MKGKRGKWYLAAIGCLVVLWALGSWALWSRLFLWGNALAIPVAVLSWPAHELCLAVSGQGMGADANCPAAPWSFSVFLVQAVATWALLVPLVVAPSRKWVWAVCQAVVLVVLFAGFWQWGNG